MIGERKRPEAAARIGGPGRGNGVRRWLDKLGIGAFGAVSGVIVIALFWGLFAIDGVLARAADEQREAASHFLQAISQPTAGGTDLRVEAVRDSLVAAASRSARTARTRLWVIGVLGILLIAVVAVRARQRALQIAARSADIERLSREALHANAMKSEFLANVSHELRTPLTAIVGFVEMLRDNVYGELAPRQIGPVDRIAASATHLRQLVDQILDIARIAAGRLDVSRELLSLRPFVLNIASELESLFAERALRLSITVPASLPRVRTDPTHLRHILVNLLGNAVKYTPSGGVGVRAKVLTGTHPTVRRTPDDPGLLAVAPNRDASWIVLQVSDTGIGIPARDHERIFDEFEQVNAGPRTDSSARGTGLGLAISRRLSRALGGDITLVSEPGKGSTFSVWIPLELSDLQATPVSAAAEPVTSEISTSP